MVIMIRLADCQVSESGDDLAVTSYVQRPAVVVFVWCLHESDGQVSDHAAPVMAQQVAPLPGSMEMTCGPHDIHGCMMDGPFGRQDLHVLRCGGTAL